ncbi:MAG: aminotransferase class IV family protein [Fidelibacterota bacterium]|nr:MAG: aminotransferase class IV family protein [Candidatus Neomarinimicrobiota bacterium]
MDSGFWFGDGLFETLRVVNGNIFRPHKHLARMREGMKILRIEFPVPDNKVIELMQELVARNDLKSTLIRLMCTRGTLEGAPWDHSGSSNLYIGIRYAQPEPAFPVKIKFVNEEDYPLGRMVPAIKSMTYLPNMLATRDAVAEGAFEPVFVNRDGLVTEGATRNIFFIQDHTLHTPDTSLGILPGVTRDLITELSSEMGLTLDMSPIPFTQVNTMDEAFISGTGIGAYPVTWEGYPESDYSTTLRIRERIQAQVQLETRAG